MYSSEHTKKIDAMDTLTKTIQSCVNCELTQSRKKTVVGAGNLDSKIVLIGEAPGRKEDESGLPFVGSAGKLLDEILSVSHLSRDSVFIGNILKCRPPKNRRPKKREVEKCMGYLMRQLEIIQPEIIAPMGNSALSYFQTQYGLEKQVIGDVHGNIYCAEASWGKTKIMPLYHPAAAIYRRNLLGELEKDMKKLGKMI